MTEPEETNLDLKKIQDTIESLLGDALSKETKLLLVSLVKHIN